MSSINGVSNVGLLSTPAAPKKSAPSSTPFGDLLSKNLLSKDGIGSASPTATSLTAADPATKTAAKSSAADEFQKYVEMSPAEKIRYNMLQDLGLTEDELKALPPQEQDKIETAIADRIKLQLGVNADASGSPQNSPQQAVGLFQTIQSNNAPQPILDTYS
jgi:hypothetical protein